MKSGRSQGAVVTAGTPGSTSQTTVESEAHRWLRTRGRPCLCSEADLATRACKTRCKASFMQVSC